MKATISNTNLTKSLINAAGISLFLFSLVLGFFVANFVSPVLAYETPFCTVTGGYSICTDQADYTPSSTVHISGSGFSPGNLLVKVTRPDGSVVTGDGSFGNWPTAYDYVAADSEGKFQFDYVLDGIEGQYLIEVLDSENNVLASHSFTDADTRYFTSAILPTTANTLESKSYTITIINDLTSSKKLGSASIIIPAGFTIISPLTVTTSPVRSWSGTIVSGVIKLDSTGGNELRTGESVSVTFSATAPATTGTYTWTTKGYESHSQTGSLFVIVGSQPTVTVSQSNGNIVIVKNTVGGDGTFSFTGDLGSFQITTSSGSGTSNFNGIVPGTYSVSETVLPGWDLTSATCSDGSPVSAISLQPGETVTCTFANSKRPILTVTKIVVNDNGGTKTEADFPLFVGTTPVTSGVQNTFDAGSYVVSETGQSGYAATISGDCDSDGNVVLSIGDVKSCTITNDDVDTTAPVTSDDAPTAWRNTDVTVTLTPTDTGGSGVANTYYCVYNSGDSACTPTTPGTSVSVTCAPGNTCQQIVRYYSTDNTGNSETAHDSEIIKIDKQAPSLVVPSDITTEATGSAGAAVSFSTSATDLVDTSPAVVCSPVSGSTFALGDHAVTCSAKDAAGNSAVDTTFNVKVQDTTAPTIDNVADIIEEATSASGATVTIIPPTSHDVVDGDGIATCNPASGSTFGLGENVVDCEATDAHSNNATSSFKITVVDTTPPVVTVPSDITEEATSPSGDVVIFTASASDIVDSSITPTCVLASGSTFVLGTTLVTCSATDSHGNTGSASFNVIVQDTTPPVITLTGPNPQTIEVLNSYTELGATASDNYDSSVTVTSTGTVDVDVVGDYVITYNAVDTAGNNAVSQIRTVHVVDTTPPVITLLGTTPVTIEIHSTYTDAGATALDNYDGDITSSIVTVNPVNDDVVGIYTVTYDVADSNGNSAAQVTRTVNVVDTTLPVITLVGANPQTIEVLNTYTELGATALDNYDGDLTGSIVIDASAVNTNLLGSYTVTYDVTDANGNSATQVVRTVHVVDTTAPVIDSHVDETAEATSSAGVTVTYTNPTATDNYDSSITVSCTPASGSTFALGDHAVTCSAKDAAGNSAVDTTFNVKVQDTTAPTIDNVVDITEEATSSSGAIVTYISPATHDLVDGDGIATCNPASGSTFALGENPIDCEVTDAHGNKATSSFKITIVDTTAPIITLNGGNPLTIEVHNDYIESGAVITDNYDIGLIATITGTVDKDTIGTYILYYDVVDSNGNHAVQVIRTVNVVDTTSPVIDSHADVIAEATSSAGATVTYILPTATDNYDSSITISCTPISGSTFPLGDTTVTCNAQDAADNHAIQTTFNVHVQDTTAPVITLLGSDPVTVEVHTSYTDDSATAFDDYDGDLTSSIVTVNPVNEDVVGDYTVTYDVADSNGNAAAQVTRTVHVVDTTPPVITVTGGDETIEVHTPYTDAGATATDNYDSIVAVTSSGTVNIDVVGDYTIFYDAADGHGNNAAQKSRSVHIVDTVAPTCSIAEPLTNSYLHGTTSIKISASDSGSGISKVEWSLDNSTWIPTTFDGTFYSADWNTAGITDGTYTIYGKATDNVGLVTYDPVNVVIDNTLPVITIISPENITYSSGSVSLTFTVNEATSSLEYSLDGAPTVPATNTTLNGLAEKSHTLTIYATDLAGNLNGANITFTIAVPTPVINTQTQSRGGSVPVAILSSANVATHSPSATSQVIVQNGKITIRSPSIVVDSVCKETVTPNSVEKIDPNAAATFTVDFDCAGVPYGDYPVTYSLQLLSGKIIATKTYTLAVKATGVVAPSVVILATIAPDLSPGETGTVTVTVQNLGNTSTNGDVALSVQAGVTATPVNIPINLNAGEMKNISFEVTTSNDAGTPSGLGALTGFASFFGVDMPSSTKLNVSVNYQTVSGFDTVSKAVDINIIPRFPYLLVAVVAVLAGIAYYFFYYKNYKKLITKASNT